MESRREAEEQLDRHHQHPACGGAGLLPRGRSYWAGRAQLLLAPGGMAWGFDSLASKQSSVTQGQERAKGPTVSCEDAGVRRGLLYQLWHLNLAHSLLL